MKLQSFNVNPWPHYNCQFNGCRKYKADRDYFQRSQISRTKQGQLESHTEILFESSDLYLERCTKREQVNLKYFSEWKDQGKESVEGCISDLKGKFKLPNCKVLNQPDAKDTQEKLHPYFVYRSLLIIQQMM